MWNQFSLLFFLLFYRTLSLSFCLSVCLSVCLSLSLSLSLPTPPLVFLTRVWGGQFPGFPTVVQFGDLICWVLETCRHPQSMRVTDITQALQTSVVFFQACGQPAAVAVCWPAKQGNHQGVWWCTCTAQVGVFVNTSALPLLHILLREGSWC